MRELKETKTIEVTIGYEAIDGTVFTDKEECERYEKITADVIIKDRFKKMIVNYIEECEITKINTEDEYIGAGCGEDNYVALVKINDEKDLDTLKLYKELVRPRTNQTITEDYIGKEVLVYIGERVYEKGEYKDEFDFDNCWVFGTIEDNIKRYTENLMQIKTVPFKFE